MLYYLKYFDSFWGPFRLFEYQSVRAMAAGATALLIGFLIAPRVLDALRNIRQPERDRNTMQGLAKEGGKVPTMGGLLIFLPTVYAALLWCRPNVYLAAALVVYLGMSLVGWIDDYRKVAKKNADGISGRQKITGQILSALAGVALLLAFPESRDKAMEIWLPFVKTPVLTAAMLPLGVGIVVAIVFFCFVATGTSNAVNLTDGLDGLAGGCIISTVITFGVVAYLAGRADFAKGYLFISHVPYAGELAVLCAALAGGTMVFLWYNAAPAEIYMGDVGALGIGGLIGMVACMINQPFLLIIVGGVFVVEALSVLIQVTYFKRTGGKRIFLMTPIHHHFQKKGWPATKIVIRFWLLSLLCGIAGLITLKLR